MVLVHNPWNSNLQTPLNWLYDLEVHCFVENMVNSEGKYNRILICHTQVSDCLHEAACALITLKPLVLTTVL